MIAQDFAAHKARDPKRYPEGYKPQVILAYSKDTPEKEIFEDIEAAEKRGLEVAQIFRGEMAEFKKIDQNHREKTEKVKESGKLERLPGFRGFLKAVQDSNGGKERSEIYKRYQASKSAEVEPSAPARRMGR